MMNEVMQITKHDMLLRDVLKFEQGRIKVMQEERMFLQKKVFTKWINSFLETVGMKVEDLYLDMRDGRMLLKLIEIISGEKLGKAHTGALKVFWAENINKSLDYLSNKYLSPRYNFIHRLDCPGYITSSVPTSAGHPIRPGFSSQSDGAPSSCEHPPIHHLGKRPYRS
uniref:Calponin-homology (CH) domain-containing protein n=1 Tax=Timema monikensis TaxID=170555 RepID=A0A7R9EHQ9_9NEOP|nr:unnamed protein product [Timema monikensis]